MSFYASSGRILVTDGAETVFDTNERLFTATNGPLTGVVSVPVRSVSPSATTLDIDTYTPLASINASASIVRGAFYVSSSGSFGVVAKGWFNASGTYVHIASSTWPALGPPGENVLINSVCAYTFVASGGVLYFNERTRLIAPRTISITGSLTVAALSISYHLFAGAFV